jgi:3-hydroxyacyl-[acyl-carrier-protein] dehydratase
MRWFWVDRFLEFESGSHARAIKNVSLAEEHLHDHFPGFAVMPGSLIIEGLAQTGGLLLSEATGFQHTVVLAKVGKMVFHSWACPGDTLIYSVTLTEARDEGGSVDARAHIGNRLVAEGEIMFAHADQMAAELPSGAEQRNYIAEAGLLDILNIGRIGTGEPFAPQTPSTPNG